MKTLEEVLEAHGVETDRNGYMVCLNHDDAHPSAKVNEEYVYCFTCGWSADAAGVEARLTARPVGEVLASWRGSKPAWRQTGTKVDTTPKWKVRRTLFTDWVADSHEILRDTLHYLPSWFHETAKEQFFVILDDIVIEYKDKAPYDIQKMIRHSLSELRKWADYWKGACV